MEKKRKYALQILKLSLALHAKLLVRRVGQHSTLMVVREYYY